MDSSVKKFGSKQKCKDFLAFSSQSCSKVRFLIVAAVAAKSLNTKVENLWDSSFSWKLFLTPLLSQNKCLGLTVLCFTWIRLDQ